MRVFAARDWVLQITSDSHVVSAPTSHADGRLHHSGAGRFAKAAFVGSRPMSATSHHISRMAPISFIRNALNTMHHDFNSSGTDVAYGACAAITAMPGSCRLT